MELSFDINSVSTRFVVLHPLYSYATVSICESPLIQPLSPAPSQALALRLLTCHEQNNKNNVREEHHNHVGGWLNSLMAISDSLPPGNVIERAAACASNSSKSLSLGVDHEYSSRRICIYTSYYFLFSPLNTTVMTVKR